MPSKLLRHSAVLSNSPLWSDTAVPIQGRWRGCEAKRTKSYERQSTQVRKRPFNQLLKAMSCPRLPLFCQKNVVKPLLTRSSDLYHNSWINRTHQLCTDVLLYVNSLTRQILMVQSPALGARETKQFKELTVSWVRHTSQQVRRQIQWQTPATVHWGLASQGRGGQGELPGRAGSCNQFHRKGILGKGSQSRREQSRVTWKITWAFRHNSNERFISYIYHICHYLGNICTYYLCSFTELEGFVCHCSLRWQAHFNAVRVLLS